MSDRVVLWSSLVPLALAACQSNPPQCPSGVHTLFSATFDNATVGAPPPASGALLYGPAGAAIRITDSIGNVRVVNSAALGSRALRLTRVVRPTLVEFVFGSTSDDTLSSGTFVITFRAVGDPVPQNVISGTGMTVLSAQNRSALWLSLFGGSYYHRQGTGNVALTGNYNPSQPHNVRIGVNLDAKTYTVCVNNVVLAANQPFVDASFDARRGFAIQMSPTITEGFAAGVVIDDVRATR